MKLRDFLNMVLDKSKTVIIFNNGEITGKIYFIEWHFKHLLDLEIVSISHDEDYFLIKLKKENEEE
jgi:hypothetical protein